MKRRMKAALIGAAFYMLIVALAGASHTGYKREAGKFTAPKSGVALYYSPGVMERVATVRDMRMLARVDGYAAVTDCTMIGHLAYARIGDGPVEVFQILDCSAPQDVERHLQTGNVIEVDYASAVRHDFTSQGRKSATLYHIVTTPNGIMSFGEWSKLQKAIWPDFNAGAFDYLFRYPWYRAKAELGEFR